MTPEFVKLLNQMLEWKASSQKYIGPIKIKESLSLLDKNYDIHEQKDPYNLLEFMLNTFDADLNRIFNPP